MFQKPSMLTVFIAAIGIALAAAGDRMMGIDADNLCSSDATAYDACQDR